MSEIFWFCLPSRPGPLTREAPLLLGNICKEWRNVALSTPQLWKYIHLDEPRSEGICLLLETWLTRGRGCPLSFSVFWTEYRSLDPLSTALWDVVERFAHQLEFLSIDAPPQEVIRLQFLQRRFPRLKKVDFEGAGQFEPSQPVTVFTETPELESVTLGHTAYCSIHFPWSQLKTLTLFNLTPGRCLEQMLRSSNIVHCGLLLGPPGDVPHALLTLPPFYSLTSFRIFCGARHAQLLDALTLPGLSDLTLTIGATDIPRLAAFLTRSSSSLRFLRLTTDVDDALLLQCLHHQSMLSLERLQLIFDAASPTPTLLHALHEDPQFLVNLRHLAITESPAQSAQIPGYEQLVLDMLSLRRATHPHFRVFNLKTKHRMHFPDAPAFRRLLKHGMSLHIQVLEDANDGGI